MKAMALVNPAAGGGRAAELAAQVLPRFGELDVRTTTAPGHATALVAAARERGVHRFLSVGGDGTLHEVVTGALSVDGPRPTVGLCPVGTGNSFGRDVHVRDLTDAVAAWRGGYTRTTDVLRLEHDGDPLYSINIVGLGFSAAAGSLMNRRFKALGAAGYIAAVLVEVARLGAPTLRFTVDGSASELPTLMLSICNSRYTGGAMCMAPAARIDDGRLDVIHVGALARGRFVSTFPKIFAGTHVQMPEVQALTGTRVELDGSEVEVMLDGEVIPMALRAVEVVPAAVEVACPR